MIYISKELYLYISFVIKKRKKKLKTATRKLCTECTTMNMTLGIKGGEGDNI